MKIASESLPSSAKSLQQMVLDLQQELAEKNTNLEQKITDIKTKDNVITSLKDQYKNLLEQFRLSQQKQFGKSSETSDAQLGLFNEAESIACEEKIEIEKSERKETEKKHNKPKRLPLPKDLPRETVIHDISDADKTCTDCGHALHKMGEEKSEQLDSFLLLQNEHTVHPCT